MEGVNSCDALNSVQGFDYEGAVVGILRARLALSSSPSHVLSRLMNTAYSTASVGLNDGC